MNLHIVLLDWSSSLTWSKDSGLFLSFCHIDLCCFNSFWLKNGSSLFPFSFHLYIIFISLCHITFVFFQHYTESYVWSHLHLHCLLHPWRHSNITNFIPHAVNTPCVRCLEKKKYDWSEWFLCAWHIGTI